MREAYRRKGWAFNLPDGIVQCEKEGWTEKLRSQKDEGCRVNGYIEVSKVKVLYVPFVCTCSTYIYVHVQLCIQESFPHLCRWQATSTLHQEKVFNSITYMVGINVCFI